MSSNPHNSSNTATPVVSADPTPQVTETQAANEVLDDQVSGQLAAPPARHTTAAKPRSASYRTVVDQQKRTFAVFNNKRNPYAIPIKSEKFEAFLALTTNEDNPLRIKAMARKIDLEARRKGPCVPVWYRCGKTANGFELDLHDEDGNRIRVEDGKWSTVENSDVIFVESDTALPLPLPSNNPNLRKLRKYLNVDAQTQMLLEGYLSYTLSAPKGSSKYVFLVVQGDQGTGKSLLCRLICRLLDPSILGLQAFPSSSKDLSIILNNTHLVVFDNVRSFNAATSDTLCIASTGGVSATRELYTDSTLSIKSLHGAIIFNSIHGFVTQSDLAQRCLTIHTLPIKGAKRVPEEQLMTEFEADLPDILAGLLDLCAKVFEQLPNAKLIDPQRMIEFSRWLAAMELVYNAPEGAFQNVYSNLMHAAQLDTLTDNPLGARLIEFMDSYHCKVWEGTPTQLLDALQEGMPPESIRSRQWPSNATSLGKQLNGLKASLAALSYEVTMKRGKQRQIRITHPDYNLLNT